MRIICHVIRLNIITALTVVALTPSYNLQVYAADESHTLITADVSNKTISFSQHLDNEGKTVSEKITEGCIETLATVIVGWARYSFKSFDFDEKTGETVAKAIIRCSGMGIQSSFVRIEESELSTITLKKAIRNMIGDDHATMSRINKLIEPSQVFSGSNIIRLGAEPEKNG